MHHMHFPYIPLTKLLWQVGEWLGIACLLVGRPPENYHHRYWTLNSHVVVRGGLEDNSVLQSGRRGYV